MIRGNTQFLRRHGSGGWTPASDPNVARWWRADLGRTMVSTKVSAWQDQVEGVSVTQGTDATRPTGGSLGGQDALSFSGSQWMRGSGFTSIANPSPGWICILVAQITGVGATHIVLDDGNGNANDWNFFYSSGSWKAGAGSSLTDPSGKSKTGIHAHLLIAASSSSSYYIDNFTAPVQTGNANTSANASMTVGANHAAAAPMEGTVAEIIVVSGQTIDSNLAGYLTDRYSGLTIS